MNVTRIGIIGRGAFGTFLKERIETFPGLQVVSWDKHKPESGEPLQLVLNSDVVIFAVPPKDYVQTLEELVPQIGEGSILVDVCTVKMVTVEALKRLAKDRTYIATHPMFGPQSFIDRGNTLKDLQLVICESTFSVEMLAVVISFLRDRVGLDVVTMTAEEHDKVQAKEQLLTQHIGCVMGLTGFELNEHKIHTVSAKYFYHAMGIVGNDRELFKQAAALNPFWPKVLGQFKLAMAQHDLEMLNGEPLAA